MKSIFYLLITGFCLSFFSPSLQAQNLVYEGTSGIGKDKHIVFIASDHEYRGEETCPAIARILAHRFGFKCTVLFGLDDNGHIKLSADLATHRQTIGVRQHDVENDQVRSLAPQLLPTAGRSGRSN